MIEKLIVNNSNPSQELNEVFIKKNRRDNRLS